MFVIDCSIFLTPSSFAPVLQNVGGEVLEAVIPHLKSPGARVPVCGVISQYNNPSYYSKTGDRSGDLMVRLKQLNMPVLGRKGSKEGFAFFGFSNLSTKQPDARNALVRMSGWMKEGKLKDREDVVHGLEASADAFIGMLKGENIGKTMVAVG